MRAISDDALLTIAEIAATLMGLLLVAVFFYVESGFFRRLKTLGPLANRYLRATAKVVLLLYALVLALSLALVILTPLWATLVLAVMSVAVLVSLGEWTHRSREIRNIVRIRSTSVWGAWVAVLLVLFLPWIVGGWVPSREVLTLTLLLVGAFAFLNSVGLLLVAFDLSELEKAAREADGSVGMPPARSAASV